MITKLSSEMMASIQLGYDAKQGVKQILVNEAYFKAIQRDSEFLEVLDSQCVHMWSGYNEAVEIHEAALRDTEMDGEEYGYEG